MQKTEQGLQVTNNFLTDMLDAMLKNRFEGIQLVPGHKPLIYAKGFVAENAYPFDFPIAKVELIDVLNALGIMSIKPTTSPMILVHVSEFFPDTDFLVYISNDPVSGLNVTLGPR